MENKKNVDKLCARDRNSPAFQQKTKIYTHRPENHVDNVEKITHMGKSLKIKACHNLQK